MIREATKADLPEMLAMARRCRESGALGEFDPAAAYVALENVLRTGAAFRTDRGVIAGVLVPSWDAPAHLMAVEFLWWAEDGQWLPLLRRFGEWAKDQGASEIRIASEIQGKTDRISKALARDGYEPREVWYRKVL